MSIEGLHSLFSPSLEPVTHCSFTYAQRCRDVLLLPALLFEVPGAFAPFFSPVGFSWCSHASYRITLYLSLPRSVTRRKITCISSSMLPHPSLLRRLRIR